MSEVKAISLKEKTFKANGNTYHISEKISVNRWREYEKLVPLLTYGVGFDETFKAINKAYSAVNDKRFADAAVILHNVMSGIKDADDDKRIHPALLMCALVINKEGEDTGIYDEPTQLAKIQDWEKEGLDMLTFFQLALNSIKGFRETYLLYIQREAQNLIAKSDLMAKA